MIKRDDYLNKLILFKDLNVIKVITGIRRCGKSTLLEIYKDYLIKNDIKENQIISLNFEDPINRHIDTWEKLYDEIVKKIHPTKQNYVFLDEVQLIENFEKAANGLFLKENVDLYITGSNAYMLSSDIATLLSGRYVEIKMQPLSFKEYMSTFKDKTDLEKRFNEYLRYSSFPEALLIYKNRKDAIDIYLDSLLSTIIFKDIITRTGINDIDILEKLIKFLFDNIGSRVSINKISNTLTSMGNKTSNHTINKYINALLDSFIIYKASRYDIKGKKILSSQEKYFVADIGFRYNILGQSFERDSGHIIENIVYLELIRRGYKVYIGKVDKLEVDFVAQNKEETIYFQVSLTVRDKNTLERELKPLENIKDHHPKFLITMDNDLDASYNGIKKIYLLDWLLK